MSSALNIDDSDGYAYMEWYMDSWTRTGLVGVDCPSRELVYPPKGVDKSRLNNVLCTKAVHEMHLADEPFDKIVSGKKTVEVRLNDEKRREISSGDIIIFYRKSHISDMCAVTVVDLRNYKNFSEIFLFFLIPRSKSPPRFFGMKKEPGSADYTSPVEVLSACRAPLTFSWSLTP